MLAEAFVARPWCLGWHWFSRLENPQRGFGLKDAWDEPGHDLVNVVTETNKWLTARVRALSVPSGESPPSLQCRCGDEARQRDQLTHPRTRLHDQRCLTRH